MGPFPHQGCSRARSRTVPAPQRSPTRSLQWFRSSCGTAASLPLGSHLYARNSRFPRAGLKPAPCSASAEPRTATAGPRERSKSQRKPPNALLPPASKGQRCPTGSGREGAGWDGRSHTRDPHPTSAQDPSTCLRAPVPSWSPWLFPGRPTMSSAIFPGRSRASGCEDRQTEVAVAFTRNPQQPADTCRAAVSPSSLPGFLPHSSFHRVRKLPNA